MVIPNLESGNGRYDLFIRSRIGRNISIVLEFKISPTEDEMEEYADNGRISENPAVFVYMNVICLV